ncbi:hypothetical protein VDGD_20540 [Verticillium dahliae]|nr:hypothetical protein VDGD_20540 [Verticillium dahliae]
MSSDIKYLLSLRAVRERAKIVGDVAKAGKLSHFDLREDKLDDVVDFVASVIKRDFGPDRFHTIPPHGRWQHFEVGDVPRIANLIDKWKNEGSDEKELTRRLIDLFFVSVLLDAGAGDHWRYKEAETGEVYERSEGIAVASLHMFNSLAFTVSKDASAPIVDGNPTTTLTMCCLVDTELTLLVRQGLATIGDECARRGFPGNQRQPYAGRRLTCRPPQEPWTVIARPSRRVRRIRPTRSAS